MSSGLNAISRPLVRESAPLVARSRDRTVANADSTTLGAEMFPIFGREIKERSEPRLLAVSEATAYLA